MLPAIGLISAFICIYLTGLPSIEIFGLKLSIYTLEAVFLLCVGLVCLAKSRLVIEKSIVLIFLLYLSLFMFFSKSGFLNYTYLIILSSAIVSPFIAWSGDLSVNKQFIAKGIIFSQCIPIFMLLAYVLDIYTNGPRFIADPDLWNESSLTFRITYGSVFAYQGFTMNPNASIFPFLVSMLLIKKFEPKLLFTKLQYLSLAVIVLLTLATNSRGNLVLLILVLAFCYISWRSLLPFGLLGIVIGVSGGFLGDGLSSYVANAVDRKLSSGFVGRFEKWGQAYDLFYANPIFGLGHDGFREVVGRGVENGWLELLANYGVIGLFLFCWYFLFVFCFRRSALCVPVIAIFSVMMIFNSAFLWPGTLVVLVFVASSTKISGVEMDDNTFHHAPRAN